MRFYRGLAIVFLILGLVGFQAQAKVLEGFIDVRYENDTGKVFLVLAPEDINNQFIFQTSLPHGVGSNDIGLDRGQLGSTRLASFERYGNKLLLKQHNVTYRSSADNKTERASVDEAFADSVLAGFEVIEMENSDSIEIDYTAYLLSDVHGVSNRLDATGQGSYRVDSSRSAVYLNRTKAFPKNTELESIVTFQGKPKGRYIRQVTPDAESVTVHMHHSFIQLPDDKYEPRAFHPYSGYFKHSFFDYSVPIEANMEQKYIRRHRLEKKDPNSRMSEAVEPIVYYLDPGIPPEVYSALEEGAKWWNQAFEAAGYKDAFQVKRLPEDADPMDVRYNIIQWVHRATRGWSYGYSVFDPRTGEILKGHVTLGSLRVRQDYLIALGLTSPFTDASKSVENVTEKQKTMALNRIKQLSAHEIGHTIGLAHNFAASENGRASVMDYPHPLIEIKKGKISLENAYDDGIGEWDKYTVAYGYSQFDKAEEENALAQLVASAMKRFKYKSDPDARSANRPSASGHLWDNGDDPIDGFEQILEVRDLALSNFGANSLPFGNAWSELEERLVPIYYAHRYQLDALVKQIGGVDYRYSSRDVNSTGEVVTFVSAAKQRKALDLVIKVASPEFLTLPRRISQLIPPKTYGSQRTRESGSSRMGLLFDADALAEAASAHTYRLLLTPERLNRLSHQSQVDNDLLSVQALLSTVSKDLAKDIGANGLTSRMAINLTHILMELGTSDNLGAEVHVQLMVELTALYQQLMAGNSSQKYIASVIKHYLETGENRLGISLPSLPPGSPI